jgi:hypothetical protein
VVFGLPNSPRRQSLAIQRHPRHELQPATSKLPLTPVIPSTHHFRPYMPTRPHALHPKRSGTSPARRARCSPPPLRALGSLLSELARAALQGRPAAGNELGQLGGWRGHVLLLRLLPGAAGGLAARSALKMGGSCNAVQRDLQATSSHMNGAGNTCNHVARIGGCTLVVSSQRPVVGQNLFSGPAAMHQNCAPGSGCTAPPRRPPPAA